MLAVEPTSLEASISGYWTKTNHCTSGGAPPELWYWVSSVSSGDSFFCRDSGTNRLAIWTESSHDF